MTCEYTTVPRMLSSSATANDSKVNRKVIANTRAGIPIQRGASELELFAMLLGYIIGRVDHDPSFLREIRMLKFGRAYH